MAGISHLLLILAVVAVSVQQDIKFAHSCIRLSDGNWRFTVTIVGNSKQIDRVLALNTTSNEPYGVVCDSSPVGGAVIQLENNNTYYFQADIDSSSGVVTPDCGQITSPEDGLAPGQYNWFIRIESDKYDPRFRLSHEGTYVYFCDFLNLTTTRNETIDTALQVNNPPTPKVVDLQRDGALETVLASSFSPANTITSGTLTRIKAFLVTENVVPVEPPRTGVSPHNCTACRTDPCSGSVIQLTDENGCVVGNTLSGPFTNTVGGAPADGSVLYSGSFEIFAFSTSLNSSVGDVFFKCDFDYCDSVTGPDLCTDRCGVTTGRKKREVSDDHKIRNIRESGVTTAPTSSPVKQDVVTVLVKVVRNTLMTERNPTTGKFMNSAGVNSHRTATSKGDDDLCNGHTGLIAGTCILGVSLIVAVAASVFFCVKISRARPEKAGSIGSSNLAFH